VCAILEASYGNVQAGLCDATVYESYITYPTDAKLIGKAVPMYLPCFEDVCKRLRLRRSRSKHDKRHQEYLAVAKKAEEKQA
jgi:hypothetical protein